MLGFPEGTEIEVSPRKKFNRRTSKQPGEKTNFNGYYWKFIVGSIADELGEIGEEAYDRIHQWIQINIGNFKEMPDGTKVAGNTSNMSSGDFAAMCSRARMWANIPGNVCEYGLYIPEPYEQALEE